MTPAVTGVKTAVPALTTKTPVRSAPSGPGRSTTLCRGTVSTFDRSLVTISASHGQAWPEPRLRVVEAHDDLELTRRRPCAADGQGARTHFHDPAAKRPARKGFEHHRGWLTDLDAQDVSLRDLYLGVDLAQVGDRHECRAGLVLDADHDHFALAHAQAADDTVDGRDDCGLRDEVVGARPLRPRLRHATAGGDLTLRRAVERGACRGHLRARRVRSRPRGLEIRLGNEPAPEEVPRPRELLCRIPRARLGRGQVRLCRLDLFPDGAFVAFERPHLRLRASEAALRLHVVDARQHLSRRDAVAFPDGQADDLAHHARTDVGVARGDDLARGGDGGTERGMARERSNLDRHARSRTAAHDERRANQHNRGDRREEQGPSGQHALRSSGVPAP